MQKSKRIFGVGRVLIDTVVVLPYHPEVDTKSLVVDHWKQIGGPVPVALSTAAFYGASTCFAGPVGIDAEGEKIIKVLSQRGIDTKPCRPSGQTGFAQIWTELETGKRTIAASPGAELASDDLNRYDAAIDGSEIVHVDGSSAEVALYAAKRKKSQNGLVTLDAGSKKPGMEELLPLVDLLIASDLFCKSWFGDEDIAAKDLLALGCQSVVRTQGAVGATYFDEQQEIHVPAIKIKPVDTNGAGDIFCGAYLKGLADGWKVQQCMKFANQVASYSCEFQGNDNLPEFDEFFDNHSDDLP